MLFKDVTNKVAGMRLTLCCEGHPEGYRTVTLDRPIVEGGSGWYGKDSDGYIKYIPYFWEVLIPQEEPEPASQLLTWEKHTALAKEMARKAYERGYKAATEKICRITHEMIQRGPEE